jgi:hypothetical protein
MMNLRKVIFSVVFTAGSAAASFAQANQIPESFPNGVQPPVAQSSAQVETLVRETARISKTLSELNARLKNFAETFSSNQGLKLSDKQQRLLAAFEYLNRAEQRLANLQTLRITLSERQTAARMRLAQNENESRAESVNRGVAVRGTTDAEEARESRRRALERQRLEIVALINEIQTSLDSAGNEIRETEIFLRGIRQRIFPEIEKELADL